MNPEVNPVRIIITDDEAPARHRIKELLEDCAASIVSEVVGEASNGHELLELLDDRQADLVLLDIRMPGMDGIEAARHLLALEKPPAVIFTTAYDTYAVKAFEMHALDYLVKPIRLQRLHDALKRIKPAAPARAALESIARAARTHLAITERGRVTLVPVVKVIFMRAEQKYVTVRTQEREYVLEESLNKLEQEFCDSFVRVHRNCLVGRAHIEAFERSGDRAEGPWEVALRGLSERLTVSRRQQHVIRQLMA